MTTVSIALGPPLIKVFQDGNSVRIGIYLACPYNGLSDKAKPNIAINQKDTHFDIMMSLHPSMYSRCSPLPPQYYDEVRDYFDLGQLAPGRYTISAKSVSDDASLPPQDGVPVYDFYETGFYIPYPVPAINNVSKINMMLLFGFVSFYYFRRKRELN